jgi:diguanylate cyclase (GGDEF)-like protein/PAS domain S-box-containing protein
VKALEAALLPVTVIGRNTSIRIKLTGVIALTTSAALVMAGAGFLGYESSQFSHGAMSETAELAEIVAAGGSAALSVYDRQAAMEILNSLRGNQRLLRATVYDAAGGVFAARDLEETKVTAVSDHLRPDGAYFEQGALLLFQPVMFSGHRIGTVLLVASMSDVRIRVERYAGIVALVLGASLLLSLLMLGRLQRLITGPLAHLAGVAQRVSSGRNYTLRAEKEANDEIGSLVDSFNDMLAQIQLREESLRESEERYALAAQGANDGLWDWKPLAQEIYLSPRWKEMLGYEDAEIHADPEEWFGRIHAADRDRVRSEIAARGSETGPVFSAEYRMRRKEGGYIWVLCRGIAVRDAAGRIVRMAGSQSDITHGKIVDPLTGLRNRLYFMDRLQAVIEECSGRADSFAVLFLDVDRFKVVNDSLGHEAGDRLLTHIAERLQASVRGADLSARLATPSVVARFGGDEFAVLLENLHYPANAASVAHRIVSQMEGRFEIRGQVIFATVSIGIAMGGSGETPRDLLRNADTAMYHAKTKGKGRFEVFDDSMRERALARMELECDLRKAIDGNQFVVYYQPEVSLVTGRVVGYEALIRWNHPQRGLVMPGEFLPLAEETGLILPLGRLVMREACRQMAEWQRNYPQQPPLAVSVNVSSRELGDPELVSAVARVLKDTRLNPGSLRIEVTESSILEDHDLTAATLRRLQQLKVSLEIDDFGTGYSSLSRLHEFPFATVKIDRSFVKDLDIEAGSAHLVETILRMAKSLGLSVVAEGIETREQLSKLAELGCGYGQGYYFSRPADARATEKAIRKALQDGPRDSMDVGPAVPAL